MFICNCGTITDLIIIIMSLVTVWSQFLLLHHSHLRGLITKSIIHCGQRSHQTWPDRSPSPDSVGDSCVSSPSPCCSHIPIIVHSPTGRLCSSATSHHTQLCRAVSTQPRGRWHKAWTFPSTQEGTVDAAPPTLPSPPDVFWLWQERKEERMGGGEEGRTEGSYSVALQGLFAGKQVAWLVMREDSWQVQQRLTAKCRWQQGNTEELSRGSLC